MAFDFSSYLRNGAASNNLGDSFREGQEIARADADAQRKIGLQAQAQRDQQAARTGIAAALSTGDYSKAAAQAALYGDDKSATVLAGLGKDRFDRGAKNTTALANITNAVGALPYEQRRAAIASAKPLLMNQGLDAASIDNFDPTDDNIRALSRVDYSYGAGVDDSIKQQGANTAEFSAQTGRIAAEQPVVVGGSLVTRSGQEVFRAPQYINSPVGNSVIEVGGKTADGYTSGTNLAPGSVTAEQLYRNAIEPQESGGRAGAIGPATKYGRAQGASQMLPATAQSMAQKLNIPWRPDLMTAKSPEGLEYQRKLGIAYTQTALDSTGGDPAKAAAFYHGGPDQSIHGPKTQAYVNQVMSRLGAVVNPQDTTRSTRVIQQGVPTTGAGKTKDAAKDRQAVISGLATTDIAIRSANDLLTHPGLSAAVGSGFDPASYGKINPVTGLPFAGTNAANFRARLDTFKAQTFLPQVQALKGMGALSDAEGKKLTDAVGALNPNMSEDEFKASLRVIIGDLQAARKRASGLLRAAPTAAAPAGATPSFPAGAAAKLRANPALKDAFEAKYGPGSAAQVLGR
ncbi:hypothetical protein ASG11_17740 [Sphingomonas sp. Leaf357]|uniref:lytic transglycosylase domain-containing protein n=1 Tax=Sphingomonas sp. Leaf357 TaxID=1736350 RepID=UPI0006F584D7|nr:lytic transglycosylase domain-containing protein [Sphingomonas sp. Leaf357]KQS01496.1 hypothetical protein ASG11_17740 [Sphingomonas sp. Leaf357]